MIWCSDFDEFIACYKPGRMHERAETWSEANPEGRWRCFDYDELLKRDKLSLDLFWIKDKSLTGTDALPAPDILATEIADDLEAGVGAVHQDRGAARGSRALRRRNPCPHVHEWPVEVPPPPSPRKYLDPAALPGRGGAAG